MANRTRNFYAGPAALPLEALERAARELVDFDGTGMSLMEHSHRGPTYEAVHNEALSLLRELIGVGDDYDVLLLQGGARQQFAMVPMNLLHAGAHAEYLVTGRWGKLAHGEAALLGDARVALSTEADGTFTRVPEPGEVELDGGAAYVHLTSNNTLFGTQYHALPATGGAPIVADMTSDLLSRPIDVNDYGLIYAGAQKNVGPAGVTVVIVKKALVESARTDIPEVFRYGAHAKKDSLWNTPPTFAIYMLRNTLAVLKARGGAAAMEEAAKAKAARIYGVIDANPDFFRCPVEPASRSMMNAVFRLPDEALEKKLVAAATDAGMVGIKGHRAVGGIRVSLYNWVEPEWVEDVASLLETFAKEHA